MISGTSLKSVTGSIKKGVLKVTISFITTDLEEFKRLENLKEKQSLVEIDIREVQSAVTA